MSRRRRVSLKGWWMYLPFVLVPFSLLFSEVWFQTRILGNEYRKNSLRSSVRQADQRLEELDDEIRELARMERVLEHAGDLGLGPPNPGQVVEIQMASAPAPETQPEVLTPVLADPPKPLVIQPIAVAKAESPQVAEAAPAALELTELEPLEPTADWVE